MEVVVRGAKGTVVGASDSLTLTLSVTGVTDEVSAKKKLSEWGFLKEPKPNVGKPKAVGNAPVPEAASAVMPSAPAPLTKAVEPSA